ncbi:hypothetical protein [Shewanella violacea]|uniref:NrfJ-related protein n=1 Tax=Shewanella violacea (strain JCM 10179 / CIP 106290 / LMG 19151 / DSS12) TaxID=637905 RepID=D4ZI40_SHEVD|nr:hypothetical protein [Shewanella violacea]BAJ01339.1 nrfJ-related protein [Shewanella violacea DSS12]
MIAKLCKLAAAATLGLGISNAWAADIVHQGTVLQTMNGGGYTYIQIQESDKTIWAAGPQVDIKKGDKVVVQEQMWMNDFTCKTLDHTFEELLFVGRIDKK